MLVDRNVWQTKCEDKARSGAKEATMGWIVDGPAVQSSGRRVVVAMVRDVEFGT